MENASLLSFWRIQYCATYICNILPSHPRYNILSNFDDNYSCMSKRRKQSYFQHSKLYLVVEIFILLRYNYQSTLHNIPEDQWSHLHCGRSLYLVISKPIIWIKTSNFPAPPPTQKKEAAFIQQSLKQLLNSFFGAETISVYAAQLLMLTLQFSSPDWKYSYN